MPTPIKHDHELIRKMKFQDNKTAAQIGRELGIPSTSVSQIIRDAPEYRYQGRGTAPEVWVPEDGIIDEVAIRRAVTNDGCPVRVTQNEAIEIIKILTQRGVSAPEIGRRIGVHGDHVNRMRSEHKISAKVVSTKPVSYEIVEASKRGKLRFIAAMGRGKKIA